MLSDEIRGLAAERRAVILAHNYCRGEVQDVADFTGDSLELARRAASAEADVIVCRYIGKDISGAGFDPNILGRSSVLHTFVLPVPRYQQLVLTGLTPASHGNAIGVGLFDVITRQVAEAMDREATYANAIACNCLGDAAQPCTVEDEETAVRVALKCCRGIDRDHPRILRIRDTLHLEYIEVSPALLEAVEADPDLEIV